MSRGDRFERFFSVCADVCQVIGITTLLVIAGHFLIGAGFSIANALLPAASDPRALSPVYADYPQAQELWAEAGRSWSVHFEPYIHWFHDPSQGNLITVDEDGLRRTVKSATSADAKSVFVLGGSTVWGVGAPDAATIPSELQRLLGEQYDVYNYGQTAYVSAQELNLLMNLLAAGNTPDIVIFYDGANDGYAGAYSPAVPRDPQILREAYKVRSAKTRGLTSAILEFFMTSNYRLLIEKVQQGLGYTQNLQNKWDANAEANLEKNVTGVIGAYESHINQAKALGKHYGFDVYFFWQPNLFSLTKDPNDYEKELINDASAAWVESQRQVYLAARKRFSGREDENIYFLGNIFDDAADPIYTDWVHIGPNGNRIVATDISGRILSQ